MEIVSLAPSNTEIIFELNEGEKLSAVTSLCNYPEEARDLENIGGWTREIDYDKIRSINPDLILASDSLQDKVVKELPEQEILQVKPNTLLEVYESILKIGERLDKEERAHEIIEKMKKELETLEISEETRVYCEEWMEPPMASGNWIPGLVEEIGGNYFLERGERSRKFKLEKLKQFDPEYIFLNVCGAGENIDTSEVLEREEWKEITAVKEENVYVINDALLNRPGPRLVEGAEKMEEKCSKNF